MARTAWLISTLVFLLVAGGVGVWLNSKSSTLDPSENTGEETTSAESTALVPDSNAQATDCSSTPNAPEGQPNQGPWFNDLEILTLSADGTTANMDSETLVEGGGVPSMIVDNNGRWVVAFQWFPCDDSEAFDKVAIITSEDDGSTWSDPELATFDGLPEDYQRPFDPTLVLTPEGQIRMYFTSSETGAKTFDSTIKIYSALSDDGIHYTFEEGVRFGLDEDPAYDAAVGYWDDEYFLITPKNSDGAHGDANHARSEDGLDFTTQDVIDLNEDTNWTGNFVVIGEALRFYGTAGGPEGLWWTETTDGTTWSDPAYLKGGGGDPAVACGENFCLMVTVGMPPQQENASNVVEPTLN